jgi:diaminopropionate ammonia-lyase
MFGCGCVIFLHSGVSAGREAAIAAYGAEIRRTEGNYDQSVAEASAAGKAQGWTVVSDFSSEGYTEIPGMVMQGYAIMLDEIERQSSAPYTHVFIQGGVGGLAAVVAGYFLDRLGADRPRLVVVEPSRANCLQRSAQADKRTAMGHGEATVMAMLECYEPSLVAWDILEKSADFYLDVDEDDAVEALRRFARPVAGDPALTIGESGASGLAGLEVAVADPAIRDRLGLDTNSRVLLIGTEGATDPELYQKLLTQGLA